MSTFFCEPQNNPIEMNLKIKAVFDNDIVVTYVDPSINLDHLSQEMRDLFSFDDSQKFTMKFIDEEGDPCMLSSETELEEAIRITYESAKDAEMVIHVFPGVPSAAGQPCPGEDSKSYQYDWLKFTVISLDSCSFSLHHSLGELSLIYREYIQAWC